MGMTFDTDVTLNAAKALQTNTIKVPTASNGSTYGPGTNGQVIKSNGTTVYWASDSNSNTIPSAYCETAAGTAAKVASCTNYTMTANTYVHVLMRYANSYNGAITLNINSKGAMPIYINGTASSSSNKTLPAATYVAFYDGTNFYFRTDGIIPGTVEKVPAITDTEIDNLFT